MRDSRRLFFPHGKTASEECGFSLLEVLVALLLLGIVLATIFQLFSANLKGLAASDDYVNAVIRGEAKMREILDDDTLDEKTWSEATQDGYRIDAVATNSSPERTENLQVKLLDIKLSIHWTAGLRERTVTLRTMKLVKKQI